MATAQDAPNETLEVEVVADSLLRWAVSSLPEWRVRARDGRSLHAALPLIERLASQEPDVVVVALGTNDVAQNRTRSQMNADLRAVRISTSSVPCVVYTTVTPFGTPFYNPSWLAAATRFNRLVQQSTGTIARWSAVVRRDRSLLLADGMHLTESGKIAYDALLRTAVEEQCG